MADYNVKIWQQNASTKFGDVRIIVPQFYPDHVKLIGVFVLRTHNKNLT